jgi:hypothetical protein
MSVRICESLCIRSHRKTLFAELKNREALLGAGSGRRHAGRFGTGSRRQRLLSLGSRLPDCVQRRMIALGTTAAQGFRLKLKSCAAGSELRSLPRLLACLKEPLEPTNFGPRRTAHRYVLQRPDPVFVIAIAMAARATRAPCPAMHSAPRSAPDGCLLAGLAEARARPTSRSLGEVGEPALVISLTHGVVCHCGSPAGPPPELTMPTTPWPPG